MVNLICRFPLVGLIICVAILGQVSSETLPTNQPFLRHMFAETSPELQGLLTQYLDTVPQSHHAKQHANRFASLSGAPALNVSYKSRVHFKYVLSTIMTFDTVTVSSGSSSLKTTSTPSTSSPSSTTKPRASQPHYCSGGCGACPAPKCNPCPQSSTFQSTCGACPPCPIPSYCNMPAPGQCPTKPVCPICNSNKVETSKTSTTTSTTTTTTSTRKPTAADPKSKTKQSSLKINQSSFSNKSMISSPAGLNVTMKNKSGVNLKGLSGGKKIDLKHEHSFNFTGTNLFAKNLKLLVSDEKQREQIMKMINAIPETTGGKEAQLAQQVLAHFGEKQPDLKLQTKRAKGRTMTFNNARTNAISIAGHLMEAYLRKRCSCPICPKSASCPPCPPAKLCQVQRTKGCYPCPTDVCPVPPKCPEFAPCPKCPEDENPDNDGPLSLLDDVDTDEVVQDDELEKAVPCKGFTCEFEKTCGRADKNPLTPKGSQSGYMRGGEDQIYGEYPSYVHLDVRSEGSSIGLCGGVIISNRHVLTAQHCVMLPNPSNKSSPTLVAPSNLKVIVGEHDRNKKDEFEAEYSVEKVCNSKKFKDLDAGPRHDFSVLTLSNNITFNDNVQPVCLPYKPVSLKPTNKCFAVGVGAVDYTSSGRPIFSDRVQKMRVKRTSCKAWGFKHNDRSRHCFTKFGTKGDTCAGDSGGPVLCLNAHKRWTVLGLVSYGSETCDGSESVGWVAVYTRVQAMLKEMFNDCGV